MKESDNLVALVRVIESNKNNNLEHISLKKKKRVCAYCRVSTDMEEQKNSYYSQINYYSNYIKSNKEWDFVGIYADEGISGTMIKKRNEFKRMVDDCRAHRIDIVIAKSISRFARNTVDTLNTVREFRELGVDVYFEKENIHTLKLDSEMFLTLYSAFAQAESESTSMNVKLGYKAKMKRGEPCGSIACYGYTWDKTLKKLIINEKESKIVKKVFNMYLKGDGSSVIARKLTEEKITAPSGGNTWHPSVIRSMIQNVKYVGDICGQKYFVENPMTHKLIKNRGQKNMYYVTEHHEPIINKKIFEKAQEIYKARSITIKDGKEYCPKYSLRHTFSSMIYCNNCGETYTRRYAKYKNKDGIMHEHVYWACSSIPKKINCGKSVAIRDDELKSLFVSLYNKYLCGSQTTNLLKKIRDVIYKENSEEKINNVENKIVKVRDQINKIIDLSLNNEISDEIFSSKNKELNEELLRLEDEKGKILNYSSHMRTEEKRMQEIEKILDKAKTMKKFDDEIFKKITNRVIIGEYDDKNAYNPNVIKFILNINKIKQKYEKVHLLHEFDERIR